MSNLREIKLKDNINIYLYLILMDVVNQLISRLNSYHYIRDQHNISTYLE